MDLPELKANRRWWLADWAFLVPVVLAGVAVAWQVACGPIIGFADNGDFGWLASPFGLEPRAATFDERYYKHVVRMWDSGGWHLPAFLCSGLLFIPGALAVSVLSFRGGFDIVCLGLVHGLFLVGGLAVVAYALRVARWPAWLRLVLGLIGVAVVCDTGHVAYLNSFFMTAATLVIAPWVIGFFALIAADGRATTRRLWSATVASCLFVWSKPQLALIGFMLALMVLRAGALAVSDGARRAARLGAVVLSLSSIALFAYPKASPDLRRAIERVNTYHAVFTGLLDVSPSPESDLRELGLDAELSRFRGQSCFGEGAPDIHSRQWRERFFRKVGLERLALFYATHPSRLLALLQKAATQTFVNSPHRLGMYEKADSTSSKRIDWWARARAALSGRSLAVTWPPVVTALLALVLSVRAREAARRLALELLAVLALAALSQFILVPVVSGFPDIGRHLYPYALLFDWTVLGGLALLAALIRHARSS